MSQTKDPFLQSEYRARMNRVLDYIEENIGAELTLSE